MCDALRGLAFAHEAGVAHQDLQLHSLLIADQGQLRVMGLAAVCDSSFQAVPRFRRNCHMHFGQRGSRSFKAMG